MLSCFLYICRTVADEQRSLALAVQSVIFRIFGSIPGPILFGVLIDSGCVYWQTECGRRANCWVYDNNLLAVRAYIVTTMGVVVCVVATFFSWVFYPPVTKCPGKSGLSVDKDENETIDPTTSKAVKAERKVTTVGKEMNPWPAKGVSNPTFDEDDILN